jgi:hypothetical protein
MERRTMTANRTEYLFSVNTHTPPTMTVDSGEEFAVEVRGAFDDVRSPTSNRGYASTRQPSPAGSGKL